MSKMEPTQEMIDEINSIDQDGRISGSPVNMADLGTLTMAIIPGPDGHPTLVVNARELTQLLVMLAQHARGENMDAEMVLVGLAAGLSRMALQTVVHAMLGHGDDTQCDCADPDGPSSDLGNHHPTI